MAPYKILSILIILTILLCSSATAQDYKGPAMLGYTQTLSTSPTDKNIRTSMGYGSVKGWNHLFDLLAYRGIDSDKLYRIFSDAKMPEYEPLIFNIRPSEQHLRYHKRNSQKERNQALTFYYQNQNYFKGAELTYRVPASVILSILQIESQCGRFIGNKPIFYYLARLASAGAKESVNESYSFNKTKFHEINFQAVKNRGEWLQERFLPHLIATIKLADEWGVSPHEIKGSYGGAIGMPQFLPGHYYTYGVDGDRDSKVNLNSPGDAIFSVAKYLNDNGWKDANLANPERRSIIWKYNHSEPYVTTVLAFADSLEREIKGSVLKSNFRKNKVKLVNKKK